MKNKILYKSLSKDMSPNGHKFVVNKWYHIDGDLEICKRGFHASENIIDAMNYVRAEVLAKVEVKGESIIKGDKQCWSDMRLVKTYKWNKRDSVSLAIFAVELVLDNFKREFPNDDRLRKAIEAARTVLKNDTGKNRELAASAEWSAASAEWSTASAAMSAWSARSAEWSAEWSAASAAMSAWSARSTANANYGNVLKQCHDFVVRRAKLK